MTTAKQSKQAKTEQSLDCPTVDANFASKWRCYVILASIALFGFLNGVANELAAILTTLVDLMELKLDDYVYILQALAYLGPLLAMPIAWLIDRFGLRFTLLACLFMTILRNGSRALLFWSHQTPDWSQWRYLYWSLGFLMKDLVVNFYYCLPLWVSESWFQTSRDKSLAWSMMIALPIMGSALGSLLVPRLISSASNHSIHSLAALQLVCLLLTIPILLLGSLAAPKQHNESNSEIEKQNSKKEQVKGGLANLMLNRGALLQVFTLSSFDSLIEAINNVLQDLFAAGGLSQEICGQFFALVSLSSAVIQLVSSRFLPETTSCQNNARRCKLYLSLQWLSFVLYALALVVASSKQDQSDSINRWFWPIGTSLLYIGVKFWSAPDHQTLVASQIEGSTSGATLCAVNSLTRASLSSLYSSIFVYLREPAGNGLEQANYSRSLLFLVLVASLVSFLYLLLGAKQPNSNSSSIKLQQASSKRTAAGAKEVGAQAC